MDDMETTAALLLKQAQAERAAVAAQIAALAETRQAFEQRLDQATASLTEIAAKLPNYAFAGGKQAVSNLAGQALDQAGAQVAAAVAPVARKERDELAALIAGLKESAATREAAQEKTSRRWIGGAVTAMAAGFLFATFGVGWMVTDARAERDASRAELADQQPRLDRLNAAFAQKKEEFTQTLNKLNRQIDASTKKLSALELKGAKLKTAPCQDSRGVRRICVAVDGKAGGRVQMQGDWYVIAE